MTNLASGGFSFAGVNFARLALGVANGVCAWGLNQPANLALIGAATGTIGSGIINPATTKLIVPPATGVLSGAMAGAGLVGPLGQSLAVVTALAISQSFSSSGQYYGMSGSVGIGADVSKVSVSNPATLIAALTAALTAALGPGPAMPMMATGLGNGIAALLALGTGTGSVNGVPGPSPGAGSTLSVVV